MRSAIHRVRPSVKISTKKYTISNHTDCRMVLGQCDQYKPGKLSFYSQLLLGEKCKDEFDGSDVQDLWDMELYAEIAEHCEDDCIKTFKLYEVITNYYLT